MLAYIPPARGGAERIVENNLHYLFHVALTILFTKDLKPKRDRWRDGLDAQSR